MCWSTLLGALTPMLTKNHTIDSELTSSNLVLSNTISEKLIETHELVFQGLKLIFQLAVIVGMNIQSLLTRIPRILFQGYRIMHVMFSIVSSQRLNKVGLWIINARCQQNRIVCIILMSWRLILFFNCL